jgi:hypothetical protein
LRSNFDRSKILQWSAIETNTPFRSASSFKTGNTPGWPMQTGHIAKLGVVSAFTAASPQEAFGHEQNILLFVLSWTWTSNPMTGTKCINRV